MAVQGCVWLCKAVLSGSGLRGCDLALAIFHWGSTNNAVPEFPLFCVELLWRIYGNFTRNIIHAWQRVLSGEDTSFPNCTAGNTTKTTWEILSEAGKTHIEELNLTYQLILAILFRPWSNDRPKWPFFDSMAVWNFLLSLGGVQGKLSGQNQHSRSLNTSYRKKTALHWLSPFQTSAEICENSLFLLPLDKIIFSDHRQSGEVSQFDYTLLKYWSCVWVKNKKKEGVQTCTPHPPPLDVFNGASEITSQIIPKIHRN